jgi:undecaprenyl diphosphate synthase
MESGFMQHLAIIPDGNRRWAKKHKLKSILGHQSGADAFEVAIKFCIKNAIKYLSMYTFSLENFNRPATEKKYLFELFLTQGPLRLESFVQQGIRVKFIGDRDYFPKKLHMLIQNIEEKTKHLNKLNLNFLFCYGARRELVHVVRRIAQDVKTGVLDLNQIDEQKMEDYLWTSNMPDPDLIIRTGKRMRISNFLLYQSAYSEFKFLDCYWPEITEQNLQDCMDEFKGVQRNFGK